MIVAQGDLDRSILLQGVSWNTYQRLRAADKNNHLRMTYDRGDLELMSPSQRHERVNHLLGRMIDQWTLVKDIEIVAGRHTTFSRKDLGRGLEADNCYWISNELAMRDVLDVDLTRDPPPDLAIEVDVTHSSIPKLPLYVALRVPEVWHWRFETLEVLRLDREGTYRRRKASAELPKFPIQLAVRLIGQRSGTGDTAIIRQFIRAIKLAR